MAEVRVKRTELRAATIDNPDRMVVQVEYRVGELPPRFLYIPKDEYTEELEAERIKADMAKAAKTTETTLEI